ncbi:DUF3862 domain-containing protein [Streptococcus cuniculipharyngis]|uniref:DUF3862 domain-containing protein n=1 Tax=Streptococcus cuniculipharyngis TaxID=1562651 RepID=A0A5C5SDU9_9STRE|nr:DUF3862 domain-containing protein [Streptococcus cuniculipharyngis]TWS98045.1 DUF3862 domain-containing protein [Streptococcus cuniculipharyngis]
MKKLSLISLTLLSSLALAACSKSNSTSQTPTVEPITTESTSSSSSQTPVVNTQLRQQFDTILVGDSSQAGEGGSTLEEVKALLGEPTSTTTSELNGLSTEELTWVDGDTTITLAINQGKTVNKAISGFLFNRDRNLSLTNFNELAEGTSYSDVLAVWGEPDVYTESKIMGTKSVGATWFSNVKGKDVTANAFLVFTDDQLAQKTETNMTD